MQQYEYTFFSSSVDCSRQFRMRHCSLCSDDYVGPILGSFQSNGLPDPPTSASNEYCAPSEFPACDMAMGKSHMSLLKSQHTCTQYISGLHAVSLTPCSVEGSSYLTRARGS